MPKDPNEPRWGTYEENTRQVDFILYSAETKRKASKITSDILKIHGVTQEDLDKPREDKIAIQLENAPSFEVKMEESDDLKEKKKNTNDSTFAPITIIDLESTPPPKPNKVSRRKK